MPTATVHAAGNGKNKTIYIVIGVILLAVVSAFLFIFLNQSQDSQNKAAEPSLNPGGSNTGSAIVTTQPTTTAIAVPQGGLNRTCEPEGATCRWEVSGNTSSTLSDATTFNYEIRDTTTGQVVKSGNTTALSVTFTPRAGHAYSCTITPINACMQGTPVTAKQSCIPSITPTVTLTPTKAISVTPSPTPTVMTTPTTTPAVSPSPTPTGTPPAGGTPTKTPTPTEIIIVSATNTPAPSATAKAGSATTSTPAPPAAGVITPTIGILLFAGLVILLGLAF